MSHLKCITFILICQLMQSIGSLETNATASAPSEKLISEIQVSNLSQNSSINTDAASLNSKTKNALTKTDNNQPETKIVFQSYPNGEMDIPDSFKMGFYFFIGLSITGILFILIKINRMRLSRAERKYGVHGDRSTQELTPLPIAIEDDSDNEDHTVFDINRQIRVS